MVSAPKVRIYELSKALGVSNKTLMTMVEKEFGLVLKSHSSSIDTEQAERLKSLLQGSATAPSPEKLVTPVGDKAPVSQPVTSPQPQVTRPQQPGQQQQQRPPYAGPQQQRPPQAGPQQPGQQQQQQRPPYSGPQQQRPPQGGPQQPGQQQQQQRPPYSGPQQQRPHQAGPQQPGQQQQQQRPPYGGPQQQRPQQPGAYPHKRPQQGPSRPGDKPGDGRTVVVEKPPSRPSSRSDNRGPRPVKAKPVVEEAPKIVAISEPLTIGELAHTLHLRETEIIKHLFMKGVMVTVNQTLDVDFARTVTKELGYELEATEAGPDTSDYSSSALEQRKGKLEEADFQHLGKRAPVVSIMGHVDHGKTSLLDALREVRHKIVDSEAGGITQSIGAYTVEKNDQRIVFLDTPGHEAFTSMRMRGAKATDIAILVVAADDGVMPQTIEAINHAKAANIPIIVAVNKIDKEGADPERVLVQLSDHGLVSEKWGGDTVTVEVSAIQKLGLDDLLEMILLVSELLDLKADATVPATGVIIEAQMDKRKGPIATALVQNGHLKVGDLVLIGSVGGRVRALINDLGQRATEAGPATPVEILGLNEVPKAGDAFEVVLDEKQFRQKLNDSKQRDKSERLSQNNRTTSGFTPGEEQQTFNLIVKADTQGSAEAVVSSLMQLSTDEIKLNILHTGTGDVSEADVMLASASNAVVLAFNVKEDANAQRVSDQVGLTVHAYDVIYHLTEAVEKMMLGKLSPDTQEVEVGQAEIRQLFTVGKTTVIAGCMVTKGKLVRNSKVTVSRNNKVVYTGTLENLKRFKDDVREVAQGYECGMSFAKFNDLEIGDIVTAYTLEETARTSL